MDGYDSSVMVALLPVHADWSALDLPHLTLAYAGDMKTFGPRKVNELGKDVSSVAAVSPRMTLRVLSTEVFGGGDNPRVDVFRFRPTPELAAMRSFLSDWDISKHPFNPHVTIGPEGSRPQIRPVMVAFDKIAMVWGDNQLVFKLR